MIIKQLAQRLIDRDSTWTNLGSSELLAKLQLVDDYQIRNPIFAMYTTFLSELKDEADAFIMHIQKLAALSEIPGDVNNKIGLRLKIIERQLSASPGINLSDPETKKYFEILRLSPGQVPDSTWEKIFRMAWEVRPVYPMGLTILELRRLNLSDIEETLTVVISIKAIDSEIEALYAQRNLILN